MSASNEPSKSQLDRLGYRLRQETIGDDDLRLLDVFRYSYREPHDLVVDKIRELNIEPAVRLKTTSSIIAKLRREHVRLTQIQDIAGCRIVCLNVPTQDSVVARLEEVFDKTECDDRRTRPSHGYRAVHVIVWLDDKPVEIQVRTSLQHWWAELSEKFADLIDPAIKYGGGDLETLESLAIASEEIMKHEDHERQWDQIRAEVAHRSEMSDDIKRTLSDAEASLRRGRANLVKLMAGMANIPEE